MNCSRLPCERGFSLVELLVALAIMGLVAAVVVPTSARFYEGMQIRQAARAALSILASAREKALSSGRPQDVQVRPSNRRLWTDEKDYTFPRSISVVVHGAAELNHDDVGVIRFYPEGGSSGGGIDLRRSNGNGTSVHVDWLVGRVTLEPLREG